LENCCFTAMVVEKVAGRELDVYIIVQAQLS
jgi:hypothetical protein